MKPDERKVPHRIIWAYGYALVPPIATHRMGPMQALLDDGHLQARLASHIWEGRFVNGDAITHILVVSDSPDQGREVNGLLEAELNRLEAPFEISIAVATGDQFGPGLMPDSPGEP